jgi:ABC-2 type transport system ATP-binding protein
MICDQLVMLREGKVIFTGKTSDLLAAQQPVVVAKPENMKDLGKLVEIAKSLGHQATLLDDAVHVKGEKNFAAELNKAAFAAGITLASLAPVQASLEETFFEMTGE